MTIGIYKITNKLNNKCYIGQSSNIALRWIAHINHVEKNDENTYLYQEMRKDGLSNFTFEILEECSIEELNDKEKYWFNFYNCLKPNGYNSQIPTDYKRETKNENFSNTKKKITPKKIVNGFETIPMKIVLKKKI